MTVLNVKNVKKTYGTKKDHTFCALQDISFQVNEGEFVGIMGPSGAGKSTLLNVIATIDTASSGQILVGENDICKLKEPELTNFRRNSLGFIFQDYNLLDTLTLQENIALPLILKKMKAAAIEEQVRTISMQLGIDNILSKYPCEVSGGQRQRAGAARAIINRPQLILADEPTGALDSKSAGDLMNCLQDMNQKQKATILLVTHDAFVASFCQRILLIKDGLLTRELYKTGTRKQFYEEVIHTFSALGGDDCDLY